MYTTKQSCGCPRNYAFRDTLTELSKNWEKEIAFGGSDYGLFATNGETDERRVFKTPDYPLSDGCPRMVWNARSITESSPDGGYATTTIPVDNSLKYQRWVYVKKLLTQDGKTYFGTNGYNGSTKTGLIRTSSGSNDTNAYFWSGDLPETDKWYLLHGVIHPAGTSAPRKTEGGIYDLGNATKVANTNTDFIFRDDTNMITVRDYLYYTSEDDVEQYFFQPNLEVMDGSHMPLELLLGLAVD